MTISIAQMSDRVFAGLAKRTTGMVFDAELTVNEPGTYDPATATYQAEGDVYLGGEIDTDFTELQGIRRWRCDHGLYGPRHL